ncbi:MAG: hypothetical protein ACYTG4_11715 [Planctomycetota bacterium]
MTGNDGTLDLKPLVRAGGVAAAAGAVAFGVGLATDPDRAWLNLLLNNFYALSLSMVAVFFLAIQAISKAGWPVLFRRLPEAMAGYLPAGAVLMLCLGFGLHSLYHWSHADAVAADPILQQKSAWLNVPGFMGRMAFILVAWWAVTRLFLRHGRPGNADEVVVGKTTRDAVVFAVVFVLTFSVASVDWVMSLEPHWFSTLFPWYVLSSVFVAGLSLLTVAVVILRRRGALPQVNESHLHDLGKYVFAFSVFWGYLWFSQYMLIWYSNIPEETTHYALREGPWWWPFLFNVVINLVVPLLFLISITAKRNEKRLVVIGLLLVAGHWFDLYLLVMPAHSPDGMHLGWLEAGTAVGIGGLFVMLVARALSARPLLPEGVPFLEESLGHHQ